MYEQVSHALLNRILGQLKPAIRKKDLRIFYTRLGANFYAIHSLFKRLYGDRDDFEQQMLRLVSVMAENYIQRDKSLKKLDRKRESNHTWFLDSRWVGMALYANAFSDGLGGLSDRLGYLDELGVNLVHVMPILKCPPGFSDGGYAVSDFRQVDDRAGTLEDLQALGQQMRQQEMLLTLDVVVNHTSDQHEWAQRAVSGEAKYQNYYYTFENRDLPDQYDATMPEVFPENAPGNFTFNEAMNRWVMTVFNTFQWDLNYRNPAVFIEMLDILLFWANQGADILRLDAVAFLWKKIGTTSQNEREAHLLLQLFKDCCQVTAPGVLFIAEAIVAPVEIAKYFGEDAVIAKECEIAYNATLMALLWDAVATRNAKLLNRGIRSLPDKLDGATWLNYVRCHDDIGLGFDDTDIVRAGYDPVSHRRFLIEYFTGHFDDSPARGETFGLNLKNGDARIAGTLASLAGLESALETERRTGDHQRVDEAIRLILLLHGVIMAFGGIPLLYYGDEIGMLNDRSFTEDKDKATDSRWIHRAPMDWDKAEKRQDEGTPEQAIFSGLQHLISLRKKTAAFSDRNDRQLILTDNPNLFVFLREEKASGERVLAVANFNPDPQVLDLPTISVDEIGSDPAIEPHRTVDLVSSRQPVIENGRLEIPGFGFYWLTGNATPQVESDGLPPSQSN